MKRRIALAVALLLTLAMVFVLASCGGGGGDDGCKSHTYSTEYTTDANGHWYEATCGCEGEVANYGAHKDEDKNGNCDTCNYVLCAHTFADTWSSDENSHYYASTCECNPQKKDEAPHADANKDGICDACKYVVCSHEYASEWSSDEENHWKAPICGCEIDAINLGAHADEDKNGNCDTCEYVICAHTFADTWSSDGAYHWYAATCGCNVTKDKAEHNGDDDDTTCPTCGASICKHTYEETLTYDDTHHWYKASCGCDVIKDKTEHEWSSAWEKDGINHWHKAECGCDVISGEEEHNDSDDEDSRCDKCGQIDFASLIGNIDEFAGEQRNELSSETLENDPVYDFSYSSSQSIKVYDNYILIEDNYGNKKYISYCGANNEIPFVINVDSGNYVQREIDFDDSSLLNFSGVFDVATSTTLEEYLITLYTLGVGESSSGFNYFCDEENSKYSFSYMYDTSYYYVFVVIEFTLDEERMGVTSLTLNEERYDAELYVEGGDNTVIYTVKQTITQGFGEPKSSEGAPNPYPASKYLLSELNLYKAVQDVYGNYIATTEQITDGCTITIAPEYTNGLYLVIGGDQAQYAEFNKYTLETALDGGWINYPIFVYGTTAGTYDVKVSNELTSISFTVVVEYKAPEKIRTAVVIDGEKIRAKTYEIYKGLEFIVGVLTNSAAESPYTNMPTVTKGDASKITFVQDGENWKAIATEAGEYEITFVSALDEAVTATLPLTVKEVPSAADILNGYFEIAENGDNVTGSIKFTPSEQGASNGTAKIKITIAGNPLLGEPDEVIEAIVSYTYENGEVLLTVTEGDALDGYTLIISDRYEIILINTPYPEMPDFTMEYKFEPAVEVIIREPTENPFTMNVTSTYVYSPDDAFIFVAGEAGKYVFSLPKGYGLLVNMSNEIINYHDNKNGTQFTLDLKARQEVTFIPQAATVGEVTVYFHIEKENKVVDINGLGGTYIFTYVMQFELTFTPDYHGASSGTLTVKDPVSSENSGSFPYTIVNGDYVFGEEAGIFVTRDRGDNWCFQGPSLQTAQQFSGPTYYEEPTVDEIPYNGFKDENELGGIYTVTVDGKEYKIIIVPSSDGGDKGKVQVYGLASSEACAYTIDNYEYIIDGEEFEIYRDVDGSWLIKMTGIDDAVKFADATVIPVMQELKTGSNTIVFSEKEALRGSKTLVFTPAANGKYMFNSSNLSVKVMYEGNEIDTSEVELEAGKTYTVVVSASEAKTYYLSVIKDTSGGNDGTVTTPDEEL